MPVDTFTFLILICSATVAAIYLLLTKWRVIYYLQGQGRFGINKLASCLFCVCFWVGFLLNLALVVFSGAPWEVLLVSLPAAALARFIIN